MHIYIAGARVLPLRGETLMRAPFSSDPRTEKVISVAVRGFFFLVLAGTVAGFITLIYLRGPATRDANRQGYPASGPEGMQGAIGIYSGEIAADPQNFIIYLRRGLTYQKMHNYEAALADLSEAVRLNPNKNTAESLGPRIFQSTEPETHVWQLDIQAHTARAEVLMALDRPEDALADIDYAVAMNSRSLNHRANRAVMRILVGRYDEAIADLDANLSRGQNIEVLFIRGFTRYLKQDWNGATQDFETAVRIAPNDGKVAEWLAKTRSNARNARFILPPMTRTEIIGVLSPERHSRAY